MNLNKYFVDSSEKNLSKFRLSDHISKDKYEQKEIIIEFNSENVDIINEEDLNQEPIQNLFDGYLGEQREAPNPLEYGPNATYRNLREGVVYKKGPDNLWEVFVKDGQPGKQGQSIGSGVGVEEVKRIIANELSNIIISGDQGSVNSVSVSSNNLSLLNSTITSSGTIGINLSAIGSSGTFSKISFDQFGRVVSGSILTSTDIPTIQTNKIQTDISNRFVSDFQINSWTSASTLAHTHSNKINLDAINQNLNTSSTVIFSSISASNFNDTNFSGDKVLVSDSSKNFIESNITSTQINYLSGTSANIQNQINDKANSSLIIPPHKLIREIYYSPHVGTSSLTIKNVLTQFSSYTITSADAQIWLNYRKILRDEFMFGVNWANNDNMVNFICTWNGVTVVDNVYARPNITGAQTFVAGQNRVLDFVNDFRIQGYSGNVVNPRNHAKWSTNYGGTVDFGSAEEYSYGQTSVDITNGINVVWSYYINGTGSPTVYFDNHRAIL